MTDASAPPTRLHVTFVCSGTICRSPMGDVVLRDDLRSALAATEARA